MQPKSDGLSLRTFTKMMTSLRTILPLVSAHITHIFLPVPTHAYIELSVNILISQVKFQEIVFPCCINTIS